jgi:hypothetical protein
MSLFMGHGRLGARRVDHTDKRCPMRRLLEDGALPCGMVAVNYEQQWRTLFKAQRLGYLDGCQRLTDKGRAFLAANG